MDLAKQNQFKTLLNLASLALAVRNIYRKAGEQNSSLVSATNSLPEAYRRAYAPLFELSPTNLMALMGKGRSAFIDRLAEATRRHPEGTLYLMRGSLLSAENRYAEAEQAFAEAADVPAIIPGVTREAPMLAATAANILYWETDRDPACLERAVDYVRRRVRLGPSPAFQSDLFLRIANTAGDDGLAQTIIWQVLDEYDDDAKWLMTVAEIEVTYGKLESALAALNHLLKLEPDNTRAKALRARATELKSGNTTERP